MYSGERGRGVDQYSLFGEVHRKGNNLGRGPWLLQEPSVTFIGKETRLGEARGIFKYAAGSRFCNCGGPSSLRSPFGTGTSADMMYTSGLYLICPLSLNMQHAVSLLGRALHAWSTYPHMHFIVW
eukprot:jgi/Botrbrau1/20099/Bobra.0173s0003.1